MCLRLYGSRPRMHAPEQSFWTTQLEDVVIADEKVAQESKKLMDDCEVTISKEKSLVSYTSPRSRSSLSVSSLMTEGTISRPKGVERDITLCRYELTKREARSSLTCWVSPL